MYRPAAMGAELVAKVMNLRGMTQKCFNHVYVQKRGFTKFSVFLKRASLLNPRFRTNFVVFSYRKNQERASKFGSILGRDRGLVNNCSAAAGRAPNWTGHTLKQFLVTKSPNMQCTV